MHTHQSVREAGAIGLVWSFVYVFVCLYVRVCVCVYAWLSFNPLVHCVAVPAQSVAAWPFFSLPVPIAQSVVFHPSNFVVRARTHIHGESSS